MTKINMEFEFFLPDDQYYYDAINKAYDYRQVLSMLFRDLRSKNKYSGNSCNCYEEIYDLLWEYMKDAGLSWEDVC